MYQRKIYLEDFKNENTDDDLKMEMTISKVKLFPIEDKNKKNTNKIYRWHCQTPNLTTNQPKNNKMGKPKK